MTNLAYTARLLNCQRPTLVISTKISFITLFFNDLTTFMCRVSRNSGALTYQNPKGH